VPCSSGIASIGQPRTRSPDHPALASRVAAVNPPTRVGLPSTDQSFPVPETVVPADQRPELPATLEAVLADAWRRLERGARDRRHGFRLPVLATVDAAGRPSSRTVVLRSFDRTARELVCWSDVHSPKIAELREQPATAWTFWDRGAQVQVRITGPATVHGPEEHEAAAHAWASMDPRSRHPWFVDGPPSAEIASPGDAGPAEPVSDPPSASDLARARAAFCRVGVVAETLDWLSLRGAHRRAHFAWDAGGTCTASWRRP
jgi:general stress protein 26